MKVFVSKSKIVKSRTNEGDLCKQRFKVLTAPESKQVPALLMVRITLTKNYDAYIEQGHKLLKQYKDYYLFGQAYCMKMETLNTVLEWLRYG